MAVFKSCTDIVKLPNAHFFILNLNLGSILSYPNLKKALHIFKRTNIFCRQNDNNII